MARVDLRSDAELLAATPAEPDAFAVFYRRHVAMVLSVVSRRAQPSDVGDLVAEVFATALVYRRRYDPKRGSAVAWLAGIAAKKTAQANRRGAVEARMCRRLGMNRTKFEPGPTTAALRVSEILVTLPEEQRRVVQARVLDDKSYEQIASEEAISAQAARKRVSRGLDSLRRRVQEEGR
jgi:DNA-directed RNA polymerase specialized sigma24 family protein